jgi:hypothetical protein
MARKLRFEYPGALYHIINRGNYRRWIFDAAATRTAFEACLWRGQARTFSRIPRLVPRCYMFRPDPDSAKFRAAVVVVSVARAQLVRKRQISARCARGTETQRAGAESESKPRRSLCASASLRETSI